MIHINDFIILLIIWYLLIDKKEKTKPNGKEMSKVIVKIFSVSINPLNKSIDIETKL